MSKAFTKVLIANRGEIALRIIRTCKERGYKTVAIYSEADEKSPHVRLANESVCIGPASSRDSYLSIEKIISAAKQTGADAIHPGYGFLSENAHFAQACEDNDITFIGPTAKAIQALGSKVEAKRLMIAAGVPVVPGYQGDDQSYETLLKEAKKISYPLLIKASAGGGGRGMRVVRSATEFPVELGEARKEALASFGDETVLLEKYIEKPRHIEFQVFGDTNGNVLHLFERECSIQRRHQKIIEESPSTALSSAVREKMAQAAISAVKASGYTNAGTVEFLFEEKPKGNPNFYFLEVNTRLQVEHPVTECITGLDLVALQLTIAQSQPIPFSQYQVFQHGHAIEVRIYAEDPSKDFMPSVGTLSKWIVPEGPGIRVDSGFEEGMDVMLHYDPMLAKLIVYAEDRDAAIARLKRALEEFVVFGVKTNISYLIDIINHPQFINGNTDTSFLVKHSDSINVGIDELPEEVLLALAQIEKVSGSFNTSSSNSSSEVVASPWNDIEGWRNIPEVSSVK